MAIFITSCLNGCTEQDGPKTETCLVVVSWHVSSGLAEASSLAWNHEGSSLPQDDTGQDMGVREI